MAQVPYNPVPAPAEPVTARGPEFNPPPEAFGVNIGRAITQFGQTTGQVGNELFQTAMQIQGLKNETTARETAIQATQEMAIAQSQYDQLDGKARSDALMGHLKNLNDIRAKYRQNLNPMAARMYDAEAANLQNRFTAASAARAGEGLKTYVNQTAAAKIDLNNRTYANVEDEDEFNSKLVANERDLQTIADSNGWSTDKYEAERLKMLSNQRAMQVHTIAEKDPEKAFTIMEKARDSGQLTQQDYERLSQYVMSQNRSVGGAALADRVYNPDKPMAKAEQEIKDQADKYSHGDALFERHAIDVLRGKYLVDKQATQSENYTNQSVIYKAIMSNNYTTVAQMRQDPQTNAALTALEEKDPKFADGVQKTLNSHWNAELKKTNDDNYNNLVGLTYTNPQRFLETNLMTTQLSDAQRGRLMQMRNQLMRDPNGDPRVTSALRLMQGTHRAELQALGIFNRPKPDEDNPDYNRYVGAMQSAIEAFTEANGRPPSAKEITEDLGPRVIQTHAEPWLGQTLWPTKVPRFNEDIPQEDMDAVRKDVISKGKAFGEDIEPTDEEIRRVILRNQFKRLYKGTTASEDTGGGTTPPQSR